jgi:hypothetical protein
MLGGKKNVRICEINGEVFTDYIKQGLFEYRFITLRSDKKKFDHRQHVVPRKRSINFCLFCSIGILKEIVLLEIARLTKPPSYFCSF